MGRVYRKLRTLNTGLAEAFATVDMLLTPALPTAAFAADGPMPMEAGGVNHWRDRHFADALSPSILKHLIKVERGAAE